MSLLKVFMQYLRFFNFYMSNDPKLVLELRNLEISGLTEIWYCGQSAGMERTVRRSWNLSTRGSAELLSTAKIYCGQSAKGPRTVRQRTSDGPPEAVQNLTEAVSVGLQCKDPKADGPPGHRGQSANGQKGGS